MNNPGGFGGPPGGGGFDPPGGGGYGPPPGGGYSPPGGYGPPAGGPPGGGGYGPPTGGPPGGGGYGPPAGGPPGGGGYGPPPGGAPGGGGYGPPAGGPPGGGGYGPPPGGGYGPPPGGGYGPPPGGFGGPPGGFGGPPGGFGGPGGMPPRPPSSGGNGSLYAGLGIGCLVVVGVVAFGVYKVVQGTKKVAMTIASAASAVGVETDGNGVPVPTGPKVAPKIEFKNGKVYKSRFGSSLHLVGEVTNVGSAPAAIPQAKVTLVDESGTAVDSAPCMTGGIRALPPQATIPCYGFFGKAPAYKTMKVETTALPVYVNLTPAKLLMTEVAGTEPPNVYAPYKVTGKVTNQSSFAAKTVNIVVGLYDAAGTICGAGLGVVAGTDLDAGASARFEATIPSVDCKPTRFEAQAFGYDK
ncbi:MAG: hypothetical protein FJ096_04015 [Deltaproteobacteria bacterium]|nr:hypothetical protein [Deltaproteobacteria bacterium]